MVTARVLVEEATAVIVRPDPSVKLLVISSVPPPRVIPPEALPRFSSAPTESVPALTVAPPEKVLAPPRTSTPAPALVKPAEPASGALIVVVPARVVIALAAALAPPSVTRSPESV